jgi:hypothetical protein
LAHLFNLTLKKKNMNSDIQLEELKKSNKVFKENAGASIIDIGDRIGLVEFHTKANSLNDEVCDILIAARPASVSTPS